MSNGEYTKVNGRLIFTRKLTMSNVTDHSTGERNGVKLGSRDCYDHL